MSNSSGKSRLGVLALLMIFALLTACGGDLPSSAGGVADFPDAGDAAVEELAVSFDELSTQASLSGDAEAASDYSDGALAIRLGARPTEIKVTFDGQDLRYWAVVTGIVERIGSGPELLKRTLVAWTGDRPEAVLRITSRSDQAAFSNDENATDLGRAIGRWNDLVRGARFIAIDGVANIGLESVAGSCPAAERDARFECNFARFSLRTEGSYELAGDQTLRHLISSIAPSVAGVVVRRTDGGRGGRPDVGPRQVQPSR